MIDRNIFQLCLCLLLFVGSGKYNAKAAENQTELEKLVDWMSGSFHNGHQSATDTSFIHINLEMVPIWQSSDKGHWLYVEQALYKMKDKPYRQRVYQLFEDEEGKINSKVFALPEEDRYVNKGVDPSFFDNLSPEDLIVREGCTVFMESQGDFFLGSTNDSDCKSDFKGASYATAKVRVFEERLISWDQGFDKDGNQVWGATKSGYIFDKLIKMQYPITKKTDQVDDYFGTEVKDPYRWLENPDDPETERWIDQQNELTFNYLAEIPFRQRITERLAGLGTLDKYRYPVQEGEYIYFEANEEDSNQPIIFRQKSMDASLELVLDPNKLSDDGTTSVAFWRCSRDGKYMAFGTSDGGSDWMQIHVLDLQTLEKTDDLIDNVKFSSAEWHGEGFYYSTVGSEEGNKYSAENTGSRAYYHRLGSAQSEDELIYYDKDNPKDHPSISISEDGEIATLSLWRGTNNNALKFAYTDDLDRGFQDITTGFDNNYYLIGKSGKNLLVMTDYQAPNYKLVEINLKKPKRKFWKDLIPEADTPIQNVSICGDKLLVQYLVDVQSSLKVYDLEGEFIRDVQLPGTGTVKFLSASAKHTDAYLEFTSYLNPISLYRYDTEQDSLSLFKQPKFDFPSEDYETTQVFYPSKDGTKIPMFLTYKKGIELNGNNPTLLYGYGGFAISYQPEFDPLLMVFLENGGIYAVANLRGGGEYGESWHKAGMFEKKQNVFDDFISAAEYLCSESYTNKDKLAIKGRSNGGLLVGAVMCQRPDLCAVALPTVGVMDMLRYHKFTIGWAWASEYGSSENKEEFEYLYKYSPLHNLRPADYPATLVLTADRDDRVVPAHSFKFTSTLQEANTGTNPSLIRIDRKAGHGDGKSLSQTIEESADIWAFVFKHLGMTFKGD